MFANIIAFLFKNFSLSLFVLGGIFALLHISFARKTLSRVEKLDIWLGYLLFFAVGITGIFGFVMHSVFADFTARFIGWASSPFQFEVAVANLGLGLTGLLSLHSSTGFRAATITSLTCFLWGAAAGHIWQMSHAHNFAPGNAGSVFYTDIFVPFILLLLLLARKKA